MKFFNNVPLRLRIVEDSPKTSNASNSTTNPMAAHLSSFLRPAKQPKSTNTDTSNSNPKPTSNNIRLKSIIVIHLFLFMTLLIYYTKIVLFWQAIIP